MLGLMQDQPLLISSIIRHATRRHGKNNRQRDGIAQGRAARQV